MVSGWKTPSGEKSSKGRNFSLFSLKLKKGIHEDAGIIPSWFGLEFYGFALKKSHPHAMLSSCWCGRCNRGGTLFTQLEGVQEFLSEISQPKSGEHADTFPWRRHVHVAIHVLWAAQWSSSLSHPFHYWKNIWPQWLQKLAKWSSCFGLSMEKDWERKHSNEGVFLPDSKSDSLTGILPVSDILSGIMYSNVFYLTYFLASILYSIWHSSWHCILHFVSNTFWHCLSHSIWHSYLTYFLAFKKI